MIYIIFLVWETKHAVQSWKHLQTPGLYPFSHRRPFDSTLGAFKAGSKQPRNSRLKK